MDQVIFDCGCSNLLPGECDCGGNQLDALGVCDGECESDLNSNGICDTDEASGCTYEEAINFNSSSVFDDGTCTFSEPCNENDCPYDVNNDGSIGITDLLDLLVYFGDYCVE